MNKVFSQKFRIKDLLLIEFNYWILSLRPQQPTLGSLVLSLKRDCGNLGELADEEAKETAAIFRKIESTLKSSFGYDKIIYLALMMIDDHVHYHIIPRYSSTRIFESIEFMDTEWPKPPNVLLNNCNEETLEKLVTYLKNRFHEANT